MGYTDDKKAALALAEDRKAQGFATSECRPDVIRTIVSELRKETGREFVTFRPADSEETWYCLCEYAGSREDNYAGLRNAHPGAHVRRDHRVQSKTRPAQGRSQGPSARAKADLRAARNQQRTYKANEKEGGELEVFWRFRHRTMQSLENMLSISQALVADAVPTDEVEPLLEELNEVAAYVDVLISLIHFRLDDATAADKIARLRNVDGRSPAEAELFLRQADKLERKRQQRLETQALDGGRDG